jgi:hypothetical protein
MAATLRQRKRGEFNLENFNMVVAYTYVDIENDGDLDIVTTGHIYYGENKERHQVRETKSGGGFLSFDPPVAHFGLGKYDRVNKVEVMWSTGEKTTIDKEFLANKRYAITRWR